MHSYLSTICAFLTFITSSSSIRLTSPNETDLAVTAGPEPDPWSVIPCDFDGYSTCGWMNEHDIPDDFDWHLGEGKDSHRKRRKQKTGVKDDRGGGGGYMYISSGRSKNRTAKLTTPFFKQSQSGCLKFWYHMRGRHVGHLKLYEFVTPLSGRYDPVTDVEKYHLLWSINGNQGQWWQAGMVPISTIGESNMRRLIFEAFDWDAGPAGNIVLDDITFDRREDGDTCNFSPSEAAPLTTTSTDTTVVATTAEPTTGQETSQLTNTVALDSTPAKPLEYTTMSSKLGITATTALKKYTRFATARISTPRRTTTRKSYQTTQSGEDRPTADLTTTPQESVSAKPNSGNTPVYIAVGVICTILVLVVALVLCVRHKKRRRFSYYDNCTTVHMTRMSPELVDPKDSVMQYYKLT